MKFMSGQGLNQQEQWGVTVITCFAAYDTADAKIYNVSSILASFVLL